MIKTAGMLVLMLFLTLLKILGCLLLCLAVMLLLAVLVPVRYRVEVKNIQAGKAAGGIQKAQAEFTWLLHFVSISFVYSQKKFKSRIRIASINIPELYAKHKQRRAARQKQKQVKESRNSEEKSREKPAHPKNTESISVDGSPGAEKQEAKVQTEPGHADRHSTALKREKHSSSRFSGIRQKAARLHREFTDESNRNAVLHLWMEFCRILKHYGPRKCTADLAFSLADPAATGYVTGLISLLPLIYRYTCRIIPDFTSEMIYLEGEFMVSGRVALGVFLVSLLRLFRDKEVRRCVRKIRGFEINMK